MGGHSKSITVGFRYYLGMHMVACHGPVDAVTGISVGSATAWTGNVTATQDISINQPNLFGGDSGQGGVVGTVGVLFGDTTQTVDPYLSSRLGVNTPAYRGVLSFVLKQAQVSANNPYIQNWAFKVKRLPAKAWYPAKADISGDANPAHIIYECITNSIWGLGQNPLTIDDTSFMAAADTLFTEGFGLSFLLTQQDSIMNFVQTVANHIGGVLTQDRASGKFVLNLIRQNYDVMTLPVFDESNVSSLDSYQKRTLTGTVNEVSVVYTDKIKNASASVTVQDLANIAAQGAVVPQTINYPGITTLAIATRVATRDLLAASSLLSVIRINVNREAWSLHPGAVFKFSWPELGINQLIMRVAQVSFGPLTSGQITIDAAEDVFGLPSSSYVATESIGWSSPNAAPAPCPKRKIIEATYWDLTQIMSAGDLAALVATDTFIETLGDRPSSDAYNYALLSKPSTVPTYTPYGYANFAPYASLNGALAIDGTSCVYTSDVDVGIVVIGSYAYIGNEIVQISGLNTGTKTLTLVRGVLDTVPVAHSNGEDIWFADSWEGADNQLYVPAETINVKLLPKTGLGTLAEASAPVDSLTCVGRPGKPYPPGNVAINGVGYPATIKGEITVSWSHRDRTQQTVSLTPQTTGNIGPEVGVTYTLRIYGTGGALRHTYTGIAGTSQLYPRATEVVDTGCVSEVQHIAVDATGGTFTVTYNGQTTAPLAWNISTAAFTTALQGLSNLYNPAVVVTGGPGNAGGTTPYILTWDALLGNVNQPTTDASLLTGGASTATVSTTVPGVGNTSLKMQLESVRGGVVSYQYQERVFTR